MQAHSSNESEEKRISNGRAAAVEEEDEVE